MTDLEVEGAQRQTGRSGFTTDANHPLPQRPMAHISADPAERSASDVDEAVRQLAEALRAAERAHRAYETELRLGDVEPAGHWSTWYAEYLLGQR